MRINDTEEHHLFWSHVEAEEPLTKGPTKRDHHPIFECVLTLFFTFPI